MPPSEAQSIVVKHRHPRMNVQSCKCHTVVSIFAQQSIETPKLSRDIEDGLRRGRWVAAHKPQQQQHLAGETSLLATRSPTAVARAPMTSRERWPFGWKHQRNQHSRYQVGPRSSPRRGNGRSRAQWKTLRSDAALAFPFLMFASTMPRQGEPPPTS